MKLAAAVIVAAALVLPAAQAAERKSAVPPVLGLDVARNGVQRLAWFDPSSLSTLQGRKAPLGRYAGSWSFSPDRSVLAIAAAQTTGYQQQPLFKLRFVNARGMRVLGELSLGAWQFDTVTWLRADRLLAVVRPDSSIAVVDPSRRLLVRWVPLVRPPVNVARLPDGLALLLGSQDSFAPAVLAVVDTDGALRTVTLDRISIGSVVGEQGRIDVRSPGFALDAATHRAFVVGTDFTVAEIDLDTLRVAYHGGSARSLAKYAYGPTRYAVWLGNGVLAVAGANYSGDETKGEPVGLRLIDTHDWSTRLVDPSVGYVWRAAGSPIFFATAPGPSTRFDAYGMDGALRYQLDLSDGEWLSLGGPYGYVCSNRDRVLRVLDVGNGVQAGLRGERPACPTLLYGQSG
jgi:hypothetical protein